MTESRLPRPWRIVEHEESFEIQAANGRHLFFIYHAEEQRAQVMGRLLKDEARRVAHGIVRRINEDAARAEP